MAGWEGLVTGKKRGNYNERLMITKRVMDQTKAALSLGVIFNLFCQWQLFIMKINDKIMNEEVLMLY